MKFDKDGRVFVHVKYHGQWVGSLCFKLREGTNRYVVGWSTLSAQDFKRFSRKIGREIAEKRADAFLANEVSTSLDYGNMFSNTTLLMLTEINQVAKVLQEQGYEPDSFTLAPETLYKPYSIEAFVKEYFNTTVYGLDDEEYRLAFANTINGFALAFVRNDGTDKMLQFNDTKHCMYYFVDKYGDPLGNVFA